MTRSALAGVMAWTALDGSPWRLSASAAAVLAPLSLPLAVVLPAAHLVATRLGSIARSRRGRAEAEADVALLADLTALGLRSGLAIRSALEIGAERVAPSLRAEVAGVGAAIDRSGTAVALSAAQGMARGLYSTVASASASGAPIEAAVTSFAAERRAEAHAHHLADLRRLPVRMLLPLALLVLPGFALLVVGPALVESLSRLAP
jgi:pilus assembly protein TadC